VHAPPDPQRLQALEAQLEGIAAAHGLDPADWVWRAEGSRPLADYLARLPREGPHERIARAIHRQAVLVNQRSVFDAEPGPHHGVGAVLYGRFSAPMREAVGVFLHQELVQARTGQPGLLPEGIGSPDELRARVISTANRARETQRQLDREANRLVLDDLLGTAHDAGTAFVGTVMGLSRGRIHVQLDEPAVDVKVYLRHQPGAIDDRRCQVGCEGAEVLRVGDAVRVTVHGRDEAADRWILRATRQ
jgi:ribonuclease R